MIKNHKPLSQKTLLYSLIAVKNLLSVLYAKQRELAFAVGFQQKILNAPWEKIVPATDQ